MIALLTGAARVSVRRNSPDLTKLVLRFAIVRPLSLDKCNEPKLWPYWRRRVPRYFSYVRQAQLQYRAEVAVDRIFICRVTLHAPCSYTSDLELATSSYLRTPTASQIHHCEIGAG